MGFLQIDIAIGDLAGIASVRMGRRRGAGRRLGLSTHRGAGRKRADLARVVEAQRRRGDECEQTKVYLRQEKFGWRGNALCVTQTDYQWRGNGTCTHA